MLYDYLMDDIEQQRVRFIEEEKKSCTHFLEDFYFYFMIVFIVLLGLSTFVVLTMVLVRWFTS